MNEDSLPAAGRNGAIPGSLGALYMAAARLAEAIPYWFIALALRVGVGMVFLKSGQSRITSDWEIAGTAYLQFNNDFFPNWPEHVVDVLTVIATITENVCGLLLILGLLARLNALALLGMTLVIQFYVWADWSKLAEFSNPFQAWDTHLFWAGALLLIVARGPGAVSADGIAGRLFGRRTAAA